MRDTPANPAARGTILLVDDNNDDARLIQLAFSKAGCDDCLVHVPDGKDALQYLLGVPPFGDRALHPFPRLVILDLAMPLMDGWGLLRHIRKISRWNDLPVIVLAGSHDLSDAKRAYDQGADSFLTKPADLTGYLDITRRLLKDLLQAGTPSAQPIPELSASNIPS